jgi:hypothetical protein
LLQAASGGSESGSTITQAELENSLSSLKDFTQQYSELFASLNATQAGLVSQYSDYTKALAESQQKDIDFREKAVSVQSKFSERMAQALDKPLNANQKEGFRNQAREARLGAAGVSTVGGVAGVGQQLKDFQDKLRKNAKATEEARKAQDPKPLQGLADEQRKLTKQAREATKALEDFSDQSDRASDVLSDIEKERGKRDLGMKTITDFVVGSQEERGGIMKSFAGLQVAGQTGTLQGFDADTRKSVFGLLDQLGSVDKRFEEFKKNLVISDAMQMGLDPRIAQMLGNATPKEQQLQQELIAITQQEALATRILADRNSENTQALASATVAIGNLTQQFSQNAQATIGAAVQDFKTKENAQKESAAAARATDLEAQKQAESEKLAAEAKSKKDLENVREAFIGEMERFVTEVRDTRAKLQEEKTVAGAATNFSSIGQGRIEAKSNGGHIYASGGAYVMKSKGTDTVPAMLTPGEFVIKKSSVDKYGAGMMNAINGGSYMATGGNIKDPVEELLGTQKDEFGRYPKDTLDKLLKIARGVGPTPEPSERNQRIPEGLFGSNTAVSEKVKKIYDETEAIKQKRQDQERKFNDEMFYQAQSDRPIELDQNKTYGTPANNSLSFARGNSSKATIRNPDAVRQNQMRLQGAGATGYPGMNGVMGTLFGGLPPQQFSPQQMRLNNYNKMRSQQGLPVPQPARPTMNIGGLPTQTAPQNVYNQSGTNQASSAGSNFDGAISGFKDFSDKITSAANVLSGMTMNHTVTVDGMLQVNSAEVAEAVKQSVAQFVVQEVTKQLGGKNPGFVAGGSTAGRK